MKEKHMYEVEEQADHEPREFYRVPVDSESSAATILVGRRKIPAVILEKAIDAFSVMVKARHAKHLREAEIVKIVFDGSTYQAVVQRIGEKEDGNVKIGLIQTQDLTKPPKIRSSWFTRSGRRDSTADTATIAFGGFVLVLFCCMAMPGLGDRLGTSKRIQNAFKWATMEANSLITGKSSSTY